MMEKEKKFSSYRELFHKEFDDTYDFIDSILEVCDKVFEIYEGQSYVGGFCTFNVSIENHLGAYIYGVVTDEKYRGRGYFKKLLDDAKRFYASKGYDFLITVPSNNGLFGMYKKLGFSEILGGVISLLGEKTEIFIPNGAEFYPFDENFDHLYSLHEKNDILIKERGFFEKSISDFEIKYIDDGYALFDNGKLIYLSCSGAKYKEKPKATLMFLNEFNVPKNILCDILLEI